MSSMFKYAGYNSSAITLNLSSWDTSSVTDMSSMFKYAGYNSSAITLNLSSWDTSSVTNMSSMFGDMRRLHTITLGPNFSTTGDGTVTNFTLPTPDTSYFPNADGYWRDVATGTMYLPSAIPTNTAATYSIEAPAEAFAIYSEEDNSLRFYKNSDLNNIAVNGEYKGLTVTDIYTGFEKDIYTTTYDSTQGMYVPTTPWFEHSGDILTIVVEEEIAPKQTAKWFMNLRNVTSMNLSKIDTSNVTDMSDMFNHTGYTSTTFSISGLNNWNTGLVTNMSTLFSCVGQNATTWNIGDLSRWNTENVTDMSGIFSYAGQNATTWDVGDLGEWNTASVIYMDKMFSYAGYKSITWSIGNISNWNTTNVTQMEWMFSRAACNKATTFDIGNLSKKTVTQANGSTYTAWDTVNVKDMSYMFYSAGENATTWNIGDLSSWSTDNVKNMRYLFAYAGYKAQTFNIGNLNNWNTANVTEMKHMFGYAGSIATTWNIGDLSNWNTANVTDMSYMFFNAATKASSFNLGNIGTWDVSKVETMYAMFNNAGQAASSFNIGTLDNWDVSSVEDMSFMFNGAGAKASVFDIGDIDNWTLTSLTKMPGMFQQAGKDATTWTIGNLKNWNTSNVTDMSYIFEYAGYNANNMTLDLSNWDTRKATNMTNMFYEARRVSEIKLGSNFSTTGNGTVTNFVFPTIDTTYFTNSDGTWYDKETNLSYAPTAIPTKTAATYTVEKPAGTKVTTYHYLQKEGAGSEKNDTNFTLDKTRIYYETSGSFNTGNYLETYEGYTTPETTVSMANGVEIKYYYYINETAFAVYSATDNSLRFYKNSSMPIVGSTYNGRVATSVYTGFEEELYEMVPHPTDDYSVPTTPWNEYATEITQIVVEEEIEPVSTAYWFYGVSNLEKGDFNNLNTTKVTDMTSMFEFAGNNVDSFEITGLNNWETQNVSDMTGMFRYAGRNATTWSIGDLSNWKTLNVGSMAYMFDGACYEAATFNIGDLSEWDTSNVTYMQYMFYSVANEAADFDLGNISNWNTSKVTNMYQMFAHAGKNANPITLDLSGWDTSSVNDSTSISQDGMRNMFYGMNRLHTIKLGANFSTTGNGTVTDFEFPTIDTSYFTNSDGKWYNTSTKVGYEPNAIPTNTAATYTVEKTSGTNFVCNACTDCLYGNACTICIEECEHTSLLNVCRAHCPSEIAHTGETSDICECCGLELVNGYCVICRQYDECGSHSPKCKFHCAWLHCSCDGCTELITYTPKEENDGAYSIDGIVTENGNFCYTCETLCATHTNYCTVHCTETHIEAFAIYSETDNSLRFYKNGDTVVEGGAYDERVATNVYTGFENVEYTNESQVPWANVSTLVEKVIVEESVSPTNTSYWFYGLKNAESFDVANLDTSNCLDMHAMFYQAGYNVTNFELTGLNTWDVSKTQYTTLMFSQVGYNDSEFSLNFSGWNLASVEQMDTMFYMAGYNSDTFELIGINNWSTPKVTTMSGMFGSAGYNSDGITLDLSGFNTKQATDMEGMFSNMRRLYSLTVGENFSFTGDGTTECYLPEIDSEYFGYSDPCWLDDDGCTYFSTELITDLRNTTYIASEFCCFVPGTQVLMSIDGETKAIEDVKPGDEIVSYNVETGENYVARVVGVGINRNSTHMAKVYFENGTKVEMTSYHPLYTKEGFHSITNYMGYDTLVEGDLVKTVNGWSEVVEIELYTTEPITTYNLAVKDFNEIIDNEENDCFYVNGILAHNTISHCTPQD